MKNVALPAAQLPQEIIEKIKTLSTQRSTSQAAIMRAAVTEFVALADGTNNSIADLVKKDYGKSIPFVNVYVPAEIKAILDGIATDLEVDRAQVVRAAVIRYLEGK
jgi:predicted transcriptional regulator